MQIFKNVTALITITDFGIEDIPGRSKAEAIKEALVDDIAGVLELDEYQVNSLYEYFTHETITLEVKE